VQVDLVIVGSGFGGSVTAMVARRLGLSVVLLEQGRHPRMAIGESTTPLSNLLLERISATYDLPRLAPLAKWGSWQRTYPQIACGLKRGFSFFCQGKRLLVAASPRDDIADTHWYREEVDHFLVTEAQSLGVEYHECVRIEDLVFTEEEAIVGGQAGDKSFRLRARLLIDATGPRGFLHRNLQLPESALPGMPLTESLYSHFTGVARTACSGDTIPYPVDDAAVHHVFDGGWVWVLRFNNGVTSAGVAATRAVAAELNLSEGEPAWRRLSDRLPALRSQFEHAMPCQPFRHMPAVSFRSGAIAGRRWAMLPSAAGFVDPLLSTGFTLTLQGIERLAQILQKDFDSAELSVRLQGYAEQTECDLLAATRLIGALYATMNNFSAFTSVSLLYFAAVSFSEAAFRLGKPELATGFLLPSASALLERAHTLSHGPDTQAFTAEVLRVIKPFNLGRFGDPALHNRYPVRAEDLLDAGSKLGACRAEIVAMLEKSGFCV
jgi:tetracycline 7-halogenase / FADH2 O2-dependent halogenase